MNGNQVGVRPKARVDSAWREHAKCQFADPALFFPAATDNVAKVQAAKDVCRTCRAKAACLQFALQTNQEAGIWGGTSEDERRKLRRAWLASRPPK